MNGCRPVYTAGWTDDKKLLMKMVEIYKQVQYIQKRGKNKFHGYSYATEADVNEKVREEMSARNIIMMPGVVHKELRNTTTKSGNTEYIYRVDMEFNFMDAETGESLVVPMSGEGQDVGDKAIFKAISGCQKYALMKAFMIPTGDDPEGDEGVDERNHKDPQNRSQSAPTSQPSNSTSRASQSNTGQSSTSSNAPQGGISDAQVRYCHKLKSDKKINDDDFKRMIAEHGDGNPEIKSLNKKAASEFINFLTNYIVEEEPLPF